MTFQIVRSIGANGLRVGGPGGPPFTGDMQYQVIRQPSGPAGLNALTYTSCFITPIPQPSQVCGGFGGRGTQLFDITECYGYSLVAATADYVIDVLLNGNVVAHVTFAAGTKVGTFTFVSGTTILMVDRDQLVLRGSAIPDATLDQIFIVMAGV